MKHIDDQKQPLVSVVMPAYNAAAFIETAIDSVICQTMDSWELIILDDCSKDCSYELAAKKAESDQRILVLRNNQNMGVARTRNRAIDMCRGQYIAFLDSDDVWHPEKLQKQLDRMLKMDAQLGYCSYAIIGPSGNKVRGDYFVPDTARFEDILKENFIQCSAMLIRSDIVKKIKFNTEYYHEDYILGLDILKAGYTAVGCTDVLASWRYIENSRSFDKRKSARNRWIIYRKYLRFPLLKCAYLFAHYTYAGLRKYLRKV